MRAPPPLDHGVRHDLRMRSYELHKSRELLVEAGQ